MTSHFRILTDAAEGRLPAQVDEQFGVDFGAFVELYEAGHLKALESSTKDGRVFVDPKITYQGRRHLEDLRAADTQSAPPAIRYFDYAIKTFRSNPLRSALALLIAVIAIGAPVVGAVQWMVDTKDSEPTERQTAAASDTGSSAAAEEARQLASPVEKALRDQSEYGDVALLDLGGRRDGHNYLDYSNWARDPDLDRWLYRTETMPRGAPGEQSLQWECDDQAKAHYRRTIERLPKLPFPYALLAGCLRQHGHPEWEHFAMEARRILEITSKVPGASPEHASFLRRIVGPLTRAVSE